MTKNWILPSVVIAFIVVLLGLDIAGIPKETKPVDRCPQYLTVESVKHEYSGAWAGEVLTVKTTDGSTYQPGKGDFYVGQEVCVNKL